VRRADGMDDPTADAEYLELCASVSCPAGLREELSVASHSALLAVPPTYISTGTRDVMFPTLNAFCKRYVENGLPLKMLPWPHMWHVFELYDELPEAEVALNRASTFLKGVMSLPE